MTNLQQDLCALCSLAEESGEAARRIGQDARAADMFEIMEAADRLFLLLTKNADTERLIDTLVGAHA